MTLESVSVPEIASSWLVCLACVFVWLVWFVWLVLLFVWLVCLASLLVWLVCLCLEFKVANQCGDFLKPV